MNEPYQEILEGEAMLRFPPGERHELICERLHLRVAGGLGVVPVSRLLLPRAEVALDPGNLVRPDLALVTTATNKPWLIAEVIDPHDHQVDTVVKKSLYGDARIPRVWIVDSRYDNVEVYHATPYGLSLKQILAGREVLSETLLPGFEVTIQEIFNVRLDQA